MPSFDIVSEIDMQEADNAINQAKKEILSRYDLKGTKAAIEWKDEVLTMVADDDMKLKAVKDILQSKMHKRGIDILSLKFEPVVHAGGMIQRQKVTILQGIEKEKAKEICQSIRDSKLKVQAQIDDKKIKVSSKSRDELQDTMAHLRAGSFKVPLQFVNMRE